jgi:uncharacterized sulfatase
LDINRSLYSLTGTALPVNTTLDGENLSETLLGKTDTGRQSPIFWCRPPDFHVPKDNPNPDLAVGDGNWKFYQNYEGTAPQLYDLSMDISETENVAEDHHDVVQRLTDALNTWNESLPVDVGDLEFMLPKEGNTKD